MNSKISLVIPVFNESIEIDNFFDNLKGCDFNLINEIIFINDCSTDNSYELLKKKIDEFEGNNYKRVISKVFLKNGSKINSYLYEIK